MMMIAPCTIPSTGFVRLPSRRPLPRPQGASSSAAAQRWTFRCSASASAAAGRPDSTKPPEQSYTDLDDFFLGPPPAKPANVLGTNGQKPAGEDKTTTATQTTASQTTIIKSFHIIAFFFVLAVGLAFLTILLVSTGDMQLRLAATKVVKRLLKTHALRQVVVILSAMLFVRFGLEPMVKVLRAMFGAQGTWEKSTEFFVLREVRGLVVGWVWISHNIIVLLLSQHHVIISASCHVIICTSYHIITTPAYHHHIIMSYHYYTIISSTI